MTTEWPLARLGDVADMVTGFPFSSRGYTGASDGVRLLRGDNVVQGRMRWESVKRWPKSETTGLDAYVLQKGDVILAMDRPWIEAGLKYAALSDGDVPALLVQRVSRLRGSERLLTPFLKYVIGSPAFTQYVLAFQTGTAVPHISGGQIRGYEFPLPPVAEQQAIADVLGAIDSKIEANERLVDVAEGLMKAQFAAVSERAGRTRFDTVAEMNPVRRLERSGEASYLPMPEMPTTSYRPRQVVPRAPGSGARFQNDDVLVARITPCLENGKIAFVDFLKDGEVGWGSTEYFVLRSREGRSRFFPYFVARTPAFIAHATQNMIGTSGRQRCPLSAVAMYEVPDLTSKEHAALDRSFGPLFDLMRTAHEEIASLENLRARLLPELMSGRIKVSPS